MKQKEIEKAYEKRFPYITQMDEVNYPVSPKEIFLAGIDSRQVEVDNLTTTIRLLLDSANDSFRQGAESRQPEIDELVDALKKVKKIYMFSSHVRPPEADKIIIDALRKHIPEEELRIYEI